MGAVEAGVDRGSAVAGAAGHAVSGEPVEDAVAVDPPEDVGVVVGDDHVAVRPPDDAERPSRVGVPGRECRRGGRLRRRSLSCLGASRASASFNLCLYL